MKQSVIVDGIVLGVANGFVARVVGYVAAENIPDAKRVAAILNAYFAEIDAEEAADKYIVKLPNGTYGNGPFRECD